MKTKTRRGYRSNKPKNTSTRNNQTSENSHSIFQFQLHSQRHDRDHSHRPEQDKNNQRRIMRARQNLGLSRNYSSNQPNHSNQSSEQDQYQWNSSEESFNISEKESSQQSINFDNTFQHQQYPSKYIQRFILQNVPWGMYKYRLPSKNKEIYDRFTSKKIYSQTLKNLIKYEIIQDIKRRISQKKQQKFQREIQVEIKSHKIWNAKQMEYNKKITLHPIDEVNKYNIDQILIKGNRLGIITKQKTFKQQHLINNKIPTAIICIISKQRRINKNGTVDQSIIVFCQNQQYLNTQESSYKNYYQRKNHENSKLKKNQYYFFDLDSIVSMTREYTAAINSKNLNFTKVLINHHNILGSKKDLIRRKKLLHSQIFNSIRCDRNDSQVNTIKDIIQKQAGIYLIQGPPGTGKTECIVNYASLEEYYLSHKMKQKKKQEHYKLMICAQSNAAVNHIARKILTDKLIGRKDMPKILRLGHTQQFDQLLLSINLPHLVEIELLGTENNKNEWSARLRWQKILLRQKINRMMNEQYSQNEINKQKDKLFKITQKLVQINDILTSNQQQFDKIQLRYLKQSRIVLSTLNTSGKYKFAKYYKDKISCLLIDQASQATEPSALISLCTGVQKVILVGDHKQLQPTVMSNNCQKTKYNRSLFERLTTINYKPYLLDTQYRMIKQLQTFPSKQFYQDKLICGKQIQIPFSLQKMPANSFLFDVKYGRQQQLKKSYHNKGQAQCVSILIGQILFYDHKLKIGVIAPYKSQIKYIEDEVNKVPMDQQQRNNIKISTVDAFQGQQVDVIIISCVRSNKQKKIGFVKDEKRLNVAITRAKYALFIFGNIKTLNSDKIWSKYINYHSNKKTIYQIENQARCNLIIKSKINFQKRQQNK